MKNVSPAKQIFLALILFSSFVFGSEPFDDNLPTADDLFSRVLLTLSGTVNQMYRGLIQFKPAENIYLYKKSVESRPFLVEINRTVEPLAITEQVLFNSGGKFAGSLTLKRTGPGLLPTSSQNLKSFRLPPLSSADTYDLTFAGFHFHLNAVKDKTGMAATFSFFDAPQIVVTDKILNGVIVRTYNTESRGVIPCYKLTGQAIPVKPGLWESRYFVGNLGEQVGGNTFFSMLSGCVTGAASQFGRGTLYSYGLSLGWPLNPVGVIVPP